jgi:transposase
MDSDKYVAMDVHKASVVIGIRDAAGKYIMESIVETKAATLLDFVIGLSGRIHLTFEEGTHSAWLYDLLKPHVAELVVCNPRRNKLLEDGNKADVIDVRKLSQLFRAGLLHPVYHGDQGTRALKELAQNYESLVSDRVRVKNRLKAIYRGRGISCEGEEVYQRKHRARWLAELTEGGVRRRAESLYQELESLEPLVTAAQKQMLAESRKQKSTRVLRQMPTLGPIWSALIVATVDTPHRFRTKRQFWAYCGLAVVTRSSADYWFDKKGELRKSRRPAATRGLNQNYNRRLKKIFKSAALVGTLKEPFKPYYEQLLAKGLRPELARLTLARKIAAITLAVWKKGERFDPEKLTKLTT